MSGIQCDLRPGTPGSVYLIHGDCLSPDAWRARTALVKRGRVEVVLVCASNRVIAIGLVGVQMREWGDCVRVSNVKIDLRVRSAQSTIAVPVEALTTHRGMLRKTLMTSMVVHPLIVIFAVKVRPLYFTWERRCQREMSRARITSSVLLTVIIASRPMLSGELPDEECRDAQQRDTARDRQPNDRSRAESTRA